MPLVIFDMDGVLYRGARVLPHAHETLERLRSDGWQVYFATNNSTATRDEYVEAIRTMRGPRLTTSGERVSSAIA